MRVEREKHISMTRDQIRDMNPSSKQFWLKNRELLGEAPKTCNIPALKVEKMNIWITEPEGKANLLADASNAKCVLPELVENSFSRLPPTIEFQQVLATPTVQDAIEVLLNLDETSGNGSDNLPSRILRCAQDNSSNQLFG